MVILELFDDFREAYPKLAWTGLGAIVMGAIIGVIMAMPASPMMQAIGATEVQMRIKAAGQSAYWGYRVAVGRNAVEQPKTLYGTVIGSTQKGDVVMSIPVADKFQQVEVTLANLDKSTIDPRQMWNVVAQIKGQSAKVDVYPDGRSVVWIRGLPLNLKVIEEGAARPETNPVTNIVDKAFAQYYWAMIWRGDKVRGAL